MKQNYLKPFGFKSLCFAAFFILAFESCGMHRAFKTILKNRQNLERLAIGMSKAQVIAIMGSKTVKTFFIDINSPYRVETLKDINNQNLEILFFYTEERNSLSGVSDDELTPVVLKDGKVEGWGRIYLADIAPSYRYHYQHYETERGVQ